MSVLQASPKFDLSAAEDQLLWFRAWLRDRSYATEREAVYMASAFIECLCTSNSGRPSGKYGGLELLRNIFH
jgi:hypothetical protein